MFQLRAVVINSVTLGRGEAANTVTLFNSCQCGMLGLPCLILSMTVSYVSHSVQTNFCIRNHACMLLCSKYGVVCSIGARFLSVVMSVQFCPKIDVCPNIFCSHGAEAGFW